MRSTTTRFRKIYDFVGTLPLSDFQANRNLRLHQLAECAAAFCFHARSRVTAELMWSFESEAFQPVQPPENMVLGIAYLVHEYRFRDPALPLDVIVDLMVEERIRQTEAEGWTEEQDDIDQHNGDMALAASAYCMTHAPIIARLLWPWEEKWFKPREWRRNYERAGALMLAEWERLNRQHERIRLLGIRPEEGKGEQAEG